MFNIFLIFVVVSAILFNNILYLSNILLYVLLCIDLFIITMLYTIFAVPNFLIYSCSIFFNSLSIETVGFSIHSNVQSLNNWNTSKVTDTSYMFYDCIRYDKSLIMWYSIIDGLWYYDKSLIYMLNDLIVIPYFTIQKNDIINNIINTSIINNIWDNQKEIMIPKYKNIFEGYKMPYNVVNYIILYILKHLGIKMNDVVDYNRFNNELLVDLHINKRNTLILSLIKHIKETNIKRYNCLSNNLIKLFNKRLNKKINIMIYNNGILLTTLEE